MTSALSTSDIPPDDGPEVDPAFLRVLVDYLRREDAGLPIDRRQVLDEFPECSEVLQHAFEAADLVADAAAELSRIGVSSDTVTVRPGPAAADPRGADSLQTLVPAEGLASVAGAAGHLGNAGAAAGGGLDTLPMHRIGRYRIERWLGGGGMGDVFLAVDERFNRKVALKIPKTHFSSQTSTEILQRFQREATTAGGLQHPYICPVYDYGEDGGRHFIAMAYIDGQTLAEQLRGRTRMPAREAVEVVRKLASALEAAHERGIVHRDLKPGNVMIGRHGEPQLTDFGLAALVDGGDAIRLSSDGAPIGTPAYMAPEQARGDRDRIGPPTDVYGLGAILYQLLTGKPPFSGPNVTAVLLRVMQDAPAPISADGVEVLPELESLCLRMLAKEPGDRPASMRAVVEALEPIMRLLNEPMPRSARVPDVAAPVVSSAPPASAPAEAFQSDRNRSANDRRKGQAAVRAEPNDGSDETTSRLAKKSPPWRSREALWGVAAALAFFAAATIYVTTDRGTLTIEVNDPDARVRITRDGVDVPAPRITLGKATAVYRVGQYAIAVDGPPDRKYEVSEKSFVIERGLNKTVVIKRDWRHEPLAMRGHDKPVLGANPGPVIAGAEIAGQKARIDATIATIRKLDALVLAKWNELHSFRLPRETPGLSDKARAEQRTTAILWSMRIEMPSRYEDLLAVPTQNILPERGLTKEYHDYFRSHPRQRQYVEFCRGRGHPWLGDPTTFACMDRNESAECLYLTVAVGMGPEALAQFDAKVETGDTDQDGMPEFLDGWGRPIEFILWPFGFKSKRQDRTEESPLFREAAAAGLYFAPGYNPSFFRYRFWPLIVSPGPDGKTGLFHDGSRFPGGQPNDGRGVYATPEPNVSLDGTPIGPAEAADNVDNHALPAVAPPK